VLILLLLFSVVAAAVAGWQQSEKNTGMMPRCACDACVSGPTTLQARHFGCVTSLIGPVVSGLSSPIIQYRFKNVIVCAALEILPRALAPPTRSLADQSNISSPASKVWLWLKLTISGPTSNPSAVAAEEQEGVWTLPS
jgi:hypothetical protein